MRINSIGPTNFGAGIRIKASENYPLLYNDVVKIRDEYNVLAQFKAYEIIIPSATKAIEEKLKEFNIKFSLF